MLSPPKSDTQVERHKFYVALSLHFEFFTLQVEKSESDRKAAIERIFKQLDEVRGVSDEAMHEQHLIKTRNNTLISAIAVIWILFSAVFSWVWDKTTTKAEMLIEQISTLESELKELKTSNDLLQREVNSVKAIRGQLMTIQSDVDNLIQKQKAKQ
jgi:DNA repair exonuclease SbcCD ATPase subunit